MRQRAEAANSLIRSLAILALFLSHTLRHQTNVPSAYTFPLRVRSPSAVLVHLAPRAQFCQYLLRLRHSPTVTDYYSAPDYQRTRSHAMAVNGESE